MQNKIIATDKSQSMKADIKSYFTKELTKLRTVEELYSEETQLQWHNAIIEIGEKYVGKGNMPDVLFRSSSDPSEEKN